MDLNLPNTLTHNMKNIDSAARGDLHYIALRANQAVLFQHINIFSRNITSFT